MVSYICVYIVAKSVYLSLPELLILATVVLDILVTKLNLILTHQKFVAITHTTGGKTMGYGDWKEGV